MSTQEYVLSFTAEEIDEKLGKIDNLADKSELPTKISELTNDAGFITNQTETDPTVPAWAKEPAKPTYTASEVGADASGTASSLISTHNSDAIAHADIRAELAMMDDEHWLINDKITALSNDKLNASELPEAVNAALAQAKDSGEFDGDPGAPGVTPHIGTNGNWYIGSADTGVKAQGKDGTAVTVKSVSESTADGGSNVVTFSDGKTLTVKNGKQGSDGKTPVRGVDYYTEADKEEFLGSVNAVRYVPQNLTEAQKAQVRANIGASAGEDVEFADSVEWLNSNGDTSKKYVLPDGYIYAYSKKTVTVPHDANDGTMTLNARPTPNGTKTATTANNGIVTTAPIEVDNTWPTCVVNVSGLEKLSENFYSTFYVFFYKADGSWVGYSAASHLGFSDSSQTLPISPDITKVTTDGGTWSQVKYVRMAFGVKGSGALTNSDIANLVVNFERLNSTKTENGWYSTGQLHSNDKATQQNSADIAALKEDVETLKANASGGGSGAKWYAIGDSITYGLYSTSASDYSQPVVGKRWVDYVAQFNGYKLTNLGKSGSGFVTGTTFRAIVDGNNFADVDLVTIMLGINDWKNEAAVNKVGTMDDSVGTTYTDKIIPELRYGIEKIIGQNPYCKIILITPINAKIGSRGTESTNWAYGFGGSITPCGSLKNFGDKLKEVCEYYGIQVIDMTNSSIVNRKSITTVLPDGIHPNLDCYKALGLELARRITFA